MNKMNVWQKYNLEVNDWDNLLAIKFQENNSHGYNFCDVGACNGIFTDFFKKISTGLGKVYSFEMNKYNYEIVKKLSSHNCICENLAVSDIDGAVKFYADNDNSQNFTSNIIGHDTSFRKMEEFGEVQSVKLDSYFKNIKIDMIKIDVEGAELQVIKGAVETLKKSKFVIIECHFDEDWEEICSFCKKNGLNFRNLVTDELIDHKESEKIPGRSEVGRAYQMYLVN